VPNDNDDQISRKSKKLKKMPGSVLKPINNKTPKYKINNQLGGKKSSCSLP
jgi:hypothetical protein